MKDLFEVTGDTARVLAPAKVNLFIDILGKRPDGFHEIATVMQAVSLFDMVTVSRCPSGIKVTCDDDSIPTGEGNVACRAARRMLDVLPGDGGVAVEIEKRIPVGRGLGGGSSDAAAVILAMNALWDDVLTPEELNSAAADVGSDVPFFLCGGAAVCLGRGEKVEPIESALEMHFVILSPAENISTKLVYEQGNWPKFHPEALTNSKNRYTYTVSGLQRGDFSAVAGVLYNGFAETVLRIFPKLSVAYTHFVPRFGAANLTGTGSAFFGLCESGEEAKETAAKMDGGLGDIFAVASLPGYR